LPIPLSLRSLFSIFLLDFCFVNSQLNIKYSQKLKFLFLGGDKKNVFNVSNVKMETIFNVKKYIDIEMEKFNVKKNLCIN